MSTSNVNAKTLETNNKTNKAGVRNSAVNKNPKKTVKTGGLLQAQPNPRSEIVDVRELTTIDLTPVGAPKIIIKTKDGKKVTNEGLLKKLAEFYHNREAGGPNINCNRMMPIIAGTANLSLRIIDWFVTNYAKNKTNNVCYVLESYGMYNVYMHYRAQLKGYSKKQFDPFKRTGDGRELICLKFSNKKPPLVTNVAQLNFFKWAITYEVLDYVIQHHKQIDDAMNATIKQKAPKRTDAIPTSREDDHVITFTEAPIIIDWN